MLCRLPFVAVIAAMGNCGSPLAVTGDLRQRVNDLPANSCYEETTSEFKARVAQSPVFEDSANQMQYMFLEGDGTFSRRLFILDQRTGTLKVIQGSEFRTDARSCNEVDVYDPAKGVFIPQS